MGEFCPFRLFRAIRHRRIGGDSEPVEGEHEAVKVERLGVPLLGVQ